MIFVQSFDDNLIFLSSFCRKTIEKKEGRVKT